ncbi:MAG: M23 family metallopeptidase [Treponema sp.]|nr:M23 family metallopeptidase [Treponema sp.]
MTKAVNLFVIIVLLISSIKKQFLFAQTAFNQPIVLDKKKLPCIPMLSSKDAVFKQFADEVEFNYKQKAAGKNVSMQFYAYTVQHGDTLLQIAARCVIPYETIATANAIANIDDELTGKTLIIPTFTGIFVCETPSSSIEIFVQKKYSPTIEKETKIWYVIDERLFYFLQDERFSPTERAYFLDADFKMPIDSAWLSSSYGMRVNPISGNWKFHTGIDLAAPEGAAVYACKSGKVVQCVQNNPIYGNYIVLQHNNGITSIYAHLSEIEAVAGDIVSSRKRIGRVGQTGLATGPHLHFEIRVNGVSTDPQRLLPN